MRFTRFSRDSHISLLLFSELTKYFLTKDVDLTVRTKSGETILHGGIYGNRPAVVDLLIQAGMYMNLDINTTLLT